MINIIKSNISIFTKATDANKRFFAICVMLLSIFVFCYAKVFWVLMDAWWNSRAYSHGFVVPFISFYFVWIKRPSFGTVSISPNYIWGIPLLLCGVFIYIIGHAGVAVVIQELSIIVTLLGIALAILGAGFLKILWFPIVYLLFMLRFWDAFTARITLPFQNFSAFLGAKLLHFIGIPVYRQSIYIELPNILLEVAEVCSGVNYLIAVMAIGIPLAYLTLRSWHRRIILLVSAFFIVILANGLRVALIGALSYYHLSGDLHGPFHVLHGIFVSIIGYIVLFAGAGFLSKGDKKEAAQATKHHLLYDINSVKLPLIMTSMILLLAGAYVNFYRPLPMPLKNSIKTFPYKIGGWEGTESAPIYTAFRESGVDDGLDRVYRKDGKAIRLYIGYFEYQTLKKQLVNYKTAKLHSAASKVNINLDGGKVIEVNSIKGLKDKDLGPALFWYDMDNRIITDKYMSKVFTAFYSLVRGRNNAAVIMISSDDKSKELPVKDHEDFINSLMPILKKYIP